ncbi:MAG: GNAT family N-acetyltransferase [Erysipelotrichaceae bacterium]|nr:GNAT family N-acetyltransferase [Erysipelotrichaceae bacterium]
MNLSIRKAVKEDCPTILYLIKELAMFERLSDHVTCQLEDLKSALFDREEAKVILAEIDQAVVGFALYHYNFSTFLGKKGLYMEDIFVIEPFRKHGVGKAMFMKLLEISKEENCGRMEWSVLDWNSPALSFYLRQGAKPMSDWTVYRIEN